MSDFFKNPVALFLVVGTLAFTAGIILGIVLVFNRRKKGGK